MKTLVLLITLVICIPFERIQNIKEYTGWSHYIPNILIGIANSLCIAFGSFILARSAITSSLLLPLSAFWGEYIILSWITSFVVLEVYIYWWHRLSHTIPLLWKFHAYHHSERYMNSLSAFRFHTVEVVVSTLGKALLFWALSLPWQVWIVYESVFLVLNCVQHANIDFGKTIDTVLSFFIITPRLHKVHHTATKQVPDGNYSTVLSVWDRLFGSFIGYSDDVARNGFGLKK